MLKAQIDTSSDDKTFDVSIANPRIRDSIYSASANAFLRKYNSDTYKSEIQGVGLNVGRKLSRYTVGGLNYNIKTVDVEDKTDDDDINESKSYLKSSIAPVISFNNTDNYLLPREGIKAKTTLEYAGIGGDLDFWKSYSTFNYYYGLEDLIDFDLIARYKSRLGYLIEGSTAPSNERFTLGGLSSVRGYDSGSIYPKSNMVNGKYTTTGGTNTFVNSIELSLPLTKSDKLRFTTFYDYGMLGQDNFTDYKRSSVGMSLDWISPVGPIQLIFPRALDSKPGDKTSSFEFALGRFF
jgi:outer membrane protein insertion porin family